MPSYKKKILFITNRNLFPQNSGDKIVSYSIIKKLCVNHDLILYNIINERPYTQDETDDLTSCTKLFYAEQRKFRSEFSGAVKGILQSKHLTMAKRESKPDQEKIRQIIAEHKPDVVIWDHLRATSIFVENPSVNVLFEHNNEYQIAVNHARRMRKNPILFTYLDYQRRMLKKHIIAMYKKLEHVIYMSEYDLKDMLVQPKSYSLLNYLPLIFNYSQHQPKEKEDLRLLFVGSLDYFPNTFGVTWFVENVFSKLDNDRIKLSIVGRDAPPAFVKKVESWKNVELFMDVPEVEKYYLESDIFVNSIFDGAGKNIKILEALAYGIPIISSKFGSRGYSGFPVPVFNSADECAELVNKLANSMEAREEFIQKEKEYYQNYSNESILELDTLIANIPK
ncbi:MAG: glycosyltransferase family 4 protein [Bacteroidales bacterium]|nr:glycosyltransferase family 4 protein [Bacteroidales bacterium]MCF8455778.1 glycosyltransferase family 4 protein [Bacteroidales bacterium]